MLSPTTSAQVRHQLVRELRLDLVKSSKDHLDLPEGPLRLFLDLDAARRR